MNLHGRSALIGALLGAAITLTTIGLHGCQKKKGSGDKAATPAGQTEGPAGPSLPPQSDAELKTPLATIDGEVITLGDFQDRINKQSPYIRARYTSLDQKKEFLESLVRFEVLAKEATARGFDKDPDVVRTMKQVMIQKLMKTEFESSVKPEDITDAEMQTYYDAHRDEYNKPEEVRLSVIVVKSKAAAEAVAKEALGEKGKTNKGFRDLVAANSVNETTKMRGGDLRYFSQDAKEIPAPVIAAAFKLEKTGDVAGPVNAGNGTWYIIKQTGRRKALVKTFDEVKRQVQNRLYRDKRTQAQKDFIEKLRGKAKITIDEAALGRVRVDTSNVGAEGGHPPMPGMGMPMAPGSGPGEEPGYDVPK